LPVASLRPGSLAFNPDTPRRLSTPLLTPIDSTPHDAKAGKTDLVGAFVGDAVVGALAVAAATALFVPGVKSKVSEGDVEGALSEATAAITGIEGFPGKAAWAGGVVAADAVAHLPVLGALIPGPAEFIGTAAAVLLASRYYVTKESSPEEDFAAFSATLPGEFPPPGGVDDVLKPASTLADAFLGVDVDVLTEDVTKAPERVTKWFNELENPVETIAPPAAALGAVVLAGQVAHFPLLSLFLPRALEVVGIAQVRSFVVETAFPYDDPGPRRTRAVPRGLSLSFLFTPCLPFNIVRSFDRRDARPTDAFTLDRFARADHLRAGSVRGRGLWRVRETRPRRRRRGGRRRRQESRRRELNLLHDERRSEMTPARPPARARRERARTCKYYSCASLSRGGAGSRLREDETRKQNGRGVRARPRRYYSRARSRSACT